MEDIKRAEGRYSGVSSLPGSPANRQPRSKIEDLRISSSFKVGNRQASARNVQHSKTSSVDSFYDLKEQKGFIDTAAPFESVRAAVSIFGGILDRKSSKVAAAEKSKNIQPDPESIEEDIQKYKKQLEVAEDAKTQALDDLYITKRLIDELKHGLEKAEAEEAQAKQDSALAQLRVKEMEQGITADDASPAARAQVEVTRARHEAAVKELGAVKEELAALQGDYDRLLTERDSAIARADGAVSACRDVERKVEELTLELIAMKEAIQSAHSLHLEAEEAKMVTAWARDQDVLSWEKELKRAEGEMQQLTEQVSSANDVKSKFDTASSLLLGLRAELASYTEGEVVLQVDGELVEGGAGDEKASKAQQHGPALASAKKELQEAQSSTEKARDDVNCLKVAASSLKAELDREAEALAALRQEGEGAAGTFSSLEAELSRVQQELDVALAKEKEARERTESLPKAIQEAAESAEQAKSGARAAREELEEAKEVAERAKADAGAAGARLLAAEKEIEAAKAAESLALGTVRAMEESEGKQQRAAAAASSGDGGAAAGVVTLSVEEYQKLSKEARDAEDLANRKLISTIEQIKDAKKSELLNLERLEAARKELEEKKAALSAAVEKEEKANEGKARAEQELRNEQRDAASSPGLPSRSSSGRFEETGESKSAAKKEGPTHVKSMSEPVIFSNEVEPEPEPEPKPKKKKSFFPRAVMFLARKKVQSLK